ncbi:hypothetical protein quinque_008802 [Culex quinquefasciatus]
MFGADNQHRHDLGEQFEPQISQDLPFHQQQRAVACNRNALHDGRDNTTAPGRFFQEECRKQAHYEPDTEIWLYEVTNINKVVKMQEFFVIDSALSFPINGSIIIIEKVSAGEVESYEFPTCEEYLKDLYCRIEALFVDTLNPNDSGFTLARTKDQRGSVRNSILQV